MFLWNTFYVHFIYFILRYGTKILGSSWQYDLLVPHKHNVHSMWPSRGANSNKRMEERWCTYRVRWPLCCAYKRHSRNQKRAKIRRRRIWVYSYQHQWTGIKLRDSSGTRWVKFEWVVTFELFKTPVRAFFLDEVETSISFLKKIEILHRYLRL